LLTPPTDEKIPSFDAWAFDVALIADLDMELDGYLEGSELPIEPFLVRGSGPAVYVVDVPPPFRATLISVDAPTEMEAGNAATLTLRYRNDGTATWTPAATLLGTTEPRDRTSPFSGADWISSSRPAAVGNETAPGEEATVEVTLLAPEEGVYEECFNLHEDGVRWFSDQGQGGPADDELCITIDVSEPPTTEERDGDVEPHDGGDADADADASAGNTLNMGGGGCGCGTPGSSASSLSKMLSTMFRL